MRTPSNSPNRRLVCRSGLVGLVSAALLGIGLVTAAAASADDDGGPGAVVFQVVDPVLNPLLGPADDPADGGDDPTELNLECDPATGACRSVPGPGQDSTAVTTAPLEPTGKTTPRHAKRHHPLG